MMKLSVHTGGRYLMADTGEPFFYLADTAWELFHRLSREEADEYLTLRAAQGFNAVQAVALAEHDGLQVPNPYGRVPLCMTDGCFDPGKPDVEGPYSYWDHVDAVLDLAAEKGLFVALLPTWGDKFNRKWGVGPEIFTPGNARVYGEWLGSRYRDRWNIIWMTGGDRPLETPEHKLIVEEMARGLRAGDGGAHLITFHPQGWHASTDYVADCGWLDFHTAQTGHSAYARDAHLLVRRMGEREEKPFMDSEPRYEDHPMRANEWLGTFWQPDDIRQILYWNLMEGVCGATYGNHSVWSFNAEPTEDVPFHWREVLFHPMAEQMRHLKALRLSRPYFSFRPSPKLIEDDGAYMAHQAAARGDGYAFVYSPLGMPVRARIGELGARLVKASWFDPRTGEERVFAVIPGEMEPGRAALFVPPASGKGNDWVLILDVLEPSRLTESAFHHGDEGKK